MERYDEECIAKYKKNWDRKYKIRKVLSRKERIEVIREYDFKPNYNRLAQKFGCCAKQIKTIIANKDKYDKDYTGFDLVHMRKQKVTFLGKVIYEYVMRAVYHEVPISSSMVCEIAHQVKEALSIDDFNPNSAWIYSFMTFHKISDFGSKTLKKCISIQGPKESSMTCTDIMQFVRQQEKDSTPAKPKCDNLVLTQEKSSNAMIETSDQSHPMEPSIGYGNINDDNCTDQFMDSSTSNSKCATTSVMSLDLDTEIKEEISLEKFEPQLLSVIPDVKIKIETSEEEPNMATEQLQPLADITTCQVALQYIKALEGFALLNENYRAIGLITQLEEVLKNPPRCTEFQL